MSLDKLLENVDVVAITGQSQAVVTGITSKHHAVKEGYAWICYKGIHVDGHQFINLAIEKGARVIIGDQPPPKDLPSNLTYVQTSNGRIALSHIAANWFLQPAKQLRLIGITGTNGKTSTAYFTESIFKAAGIKTALLGTINYHFGKSILPAKTTTPDQIRLHNLFLRIANAKIKHVIMEASSQGMAQYRLSGLTFHVGAFTNLTQDHLDYHHSMENYLESKLTLFQQIDPESGCAIVNMDIPAANRVVKATNAPVISYGVKSEADLMASDISSNLNGISFKAITPKGKVIIKLPMLGDYNVYNALASIGIGLHNKCSLSQIKKGLESTIVPGRFEPVNCGQDFAVIVDYAHTPDALENLLQAANRIKKNRTICVFGCGGDRDQSKRPMMGEIASKLADHSIITSDNPRTEDPDQILADITSGIADTTRYQLIPDRRIAIRCAIELAQTGDLIVIAGKGHEDYQVIGQERLPFDDRQVAREFLNPPMTTFDQ